MLLSAVGAALSEGCSVGEGFGEVRGRISVPQCEVNDPSYNMEPDFFGGDWHAGTLILHVARGGETGEYNDELVIRIADTRYIQEHLNQRIAVGPPGTAPIQAVLRLTHLCGRRGITRFAPNAALEAGEGYAIFRSIYRGDPTSEATARFVDISEFSFLLRDPRALVDIRPDRDVASGDGREPPPLGATRGEIEGSLRFYFARGRPAQRFQ